MSRARRVEQRLGAATPHVGGVHYGAPLGSAIGFVRLRDGKRVKVRAVVDDLKQVAEHFAAGSAGHFAELLQDVRGSFAWGEALAVVGDRQAVNFQPEFVR